MTSAAEMRFAHGESRRERDEAKVRDYVSQYRGRGGPVQIAWSGYWDPDGVKRWLIAQGYRLENVNEYGADIHW